MTTELFIPIRFNTSVQLKPNEISTNIDEVIYKKLKKLENMCSKHGYIKTNSIKIIKRSAGSIIVSQFNGNIMYNLQCIAEICNPAQGSIIKCKVKAKNTLGLLAEGFYDNQPILHIIVPKISAGIISEINIDNVKVGDDINIEVCGKKFLLYDKHISIIGKAIKDKEVKIKNVVDDVIDINDDEKPIDDIDNITIINDFDDDKNTDINDEEIEEDEDENNEDEKIEDDEDELEDGISSIGGSDKEVIEEFEDFVDDYTN